MTLNGWFSFNLLLIFTDKGNSFSCGTNFRRITALNDDQPTWPNLSYEASAENDVNDLHVTRTQKDDVTNIHDFRRVHVISTQIDLQTQKDDVFNIFHGLEYVPQRLFNCDLIWECCRCGNCLMNDAVEISCVGRCGSTPIRDTRRRSQWTTSVLELVMGVVAS
jgi:hypothetical protein